MDKNTKLIIAGLAVALLVSFMSYKRPVIVNVDTPETQSANATPLGGRSYFTRKAMATATTSLTYMTAGTATTTLIYDAGESANNTASLAILLQATSTGTILNWQYEYSPGNGGVDCVAIPTGCTWFIDGLGTGFNYSTSTPITPGNGIVYSWTFATSTQGCAANIGVTGARACKIVAMPTPARYAKVVFTLPVGSLNAGIYAEIIAQKEN